MDLTESFEWNGRTIACGRAGRGPDVVFCHGTPFSSRVWSRYADALSDDFTVHLWDMPGYGRSSKHPDHAVDFAAQARAFAALLEHWQLDRPHVVAHDFGGAVSLRTALVENVPYASLMLVDVVAIPPSGSPFFRFVQRHPTTLDELPACVHEAVLRAYIRAASHSGLDDSDLAELIEPWTIAAGQPAFYRQIAQYDENYLVQNEERLPALKLPVHVVWGAEDAWIPPATGRRVADLIPGAAYTEVPGAGHLMQYDAPVALGNLLRRWLTRNAGASTAG
ncbi:MAG TPA: alpha/beta hydrolase [Mycobacteriales bacterium]|nr:alpha/beta hydrolase [Mycobacteriales bacterium]